VYHKAARRLCAIDLLLRRMDRTKMLEDSLREASCLGDIEVVEELLNKGVNVNSKHDINGW